MFIGLENRSITKFFFIPKNVEVLKSLLKKEVPTELLILVGEMPSEFLDCVLDESCQEWIKETFNFKRLLRISSILRSHQWTYCNLDLSDAGGCWEAICLIDNAFQGKHSLGKVSSPTALESSFDRIWRTCDLFDERMLDEPMHHPQCVKPRFRPDSHSG